MGDISSCRICSARTFVIRSGPELTVYRCSGCGTLWALHAATNAGDDAPAGSSGVWNPALAPREFIAALEFRRDRQAKVIVDAFKDFLVQQTVADFGCGSGIFLRQAAAAGLIVFGTDLYVTPCFYADERARVLMKRPWELPDRRIDVLVMLDVLEHHPDPDQFIKVLKEAGVHGVLVKVPLVEGPIASLSRILNGCRIPTLLDQLLLIGDPFPHCVYFSSRGLVRLFEKHGYRLRKRMQIAEVGHELNDRLRLKVLPRWILSVVGALFERVGSVWSDTAVFFFRFEGDTSNNSG